MTGALAQVELSGTARILDWTGSLVTTRPTAPCDAITQLSFRFSALVLGLSALQLSVDIAKEVTGASGASGMLEAQPSYRRRTAALRPGWFTIALCSLGRAGWHAMPACLGYALSPLQAASAMRSTAGCVSGRHLRPRGPVGRGMSSVSFFVSAGMDVAIALRKSQRAEWQARVASAANAVIFWWRPLQER